VRATLFTLTCIRSHRLLWATVALLSLSLPQPLKYIFLRLPPGRTHNLTTRLTIYPTSHIPRLTLNLAFRSNSNRQRICSRTGSNSLRISSRTSNSSSSSGLHLPNTHSGNSYPLLRRGSIWRDSTRDSPSSRNPNRSHLLARCLRLRTTSPSTQYFLLWVSTARSNAEMERGYPQLVFLRGMFKARSPRTPRLRHHPSPLRVPPGDTRTYHQTASDR
jgi:hypothetical protein